MSNSQLYAVYDGVHADRMLNTYVAKFDFKPTSKSKITYGSAELCYKKNSKSIIYGEINIPEGKYNICNLKKLCKDVENAKFQERLFPVDSTPLINFLKNVVNIENFYYIVAGFLKGYMR